MPNAAQARGGALRNPEFRKFWIGETVSLVGTEVTRIALPLVAILSLGASAFEVGVLNAARYVPIVAISLFAGIWLERCRRRPILIATNVGRAVVIGLIPVASVTHVLSFGLLLAVALIVGVLTVIFDVGSLTYIPGLVDRRVLADANGRLQASFSLALIVGPSVGGYLVGALDAPRALTVDAASFVFSVLMLGLIRVREPAPEVPEVRAPWRSQIAEGLHAVYGSPILRSLLAQSATFNLATNAMLTVFVVYAIRTVGLSATQLGLVLGVGAFGALAGSMVANRVTRLIGLGRALRITTVCGCGAPLLFLAAHGRGALSMTILIAAYAVYSLNLVIFNVNTVTLRQVVTPPQVLARMNASYRMVLFGTIPVGALLGGTLGQYAGLRPAMIITVLLLTTPVAWTPFSPVFRLRAMPTGPLAGGAADGPAGEPEDLTPAGEPKGATA
jgi:Na+/melibiose symporter-like transporter